MSQLTKYEDQKNELDYFKSLAMVAAKSGNYAGMTSDTLVNMMLSAKDFGVSPMKAINGGFYVVNGKICMSTALMADRIRKDGHSIKIPEWTSEKCIIMGIRKDNGDSVKLEFTMEDAQRAGLTNSPTWKKFPKNMLYNRAMSTLARVLFSDVVGNAYSEEERFDIQGIAPEKRPVEEPMEEIVLETKAIAPEFVTEDQIEEINSLLDIIPHATKKFLEWFKVESVSQIPYSQFDKAVKSLNLKIDKEGAA